MQAAQTSSGRRLLSNAESFSQKSDADYRRFVRRPRFWKLISAPGANSVVAGLPLNFVQEGLESRTICTR